MPDNELLEHLLNQPTEPGQINDKTRIYTKQQWEQIQKEEGKQIPQIIYQEKQGRHGPWVYAVGVFVAVAGACVGFGIGAYSDGRRVDLETISDTIQQISRTAG